MLLRNRMVSRSGLKDRVKYKSTEFLEYNTKYPF